jgi:hypothetical protein
MTPRTAPATGGSRIVPHVAPNCDQAWFDRTAQEPICWLLHFGTGRDLRGHTVQGDTDVRLLFETAATLRRLARMESGDVAFRLNSIAMDLEATAMAEARGVERDEPLQPPKLN